MKTPLISVIIPAYHAEKFIARALMSIHNQILQDLEVICVIDDYRHDQTLDICRSLDYNGFRYIVQFKKSSPANARNRAIREARGKYLAFLDADDEWCPDHLASAVRTFEQNPEAQVYYAKCVNFLGNEPVSFHGHPIDTIGEFCPAPFSTVVCTNPPKAFFDERLTAADDWKWLLEMYGKGVKILFNPVIESYYYTHGNNLTSCSPRWAWQEFMVWWSLGNYRKALPYLPRALYVRLLR
jgi:glycosyltransferase involved in cell wall biosynthesis